MEKISGNLVDIISGRIRPVEILIKDHKIHSVEDCESEYDLYILPGFIDSHVHIESTMMTPLQFSRFAVSKGTVAIVTDVHEIANVLGERGIGFMQKSARKSALKIFFTAPSCVPATAFDRSGATLDAGKVSELLKTGRFVGLSEMMNYPGVLHKDPDVLKKLEAAAIMHLPADGHAPGLKGEELRTYISYGINTDHECTTLDEAIEKIKEGMIISIREGSSAKNYEALKELIRLYPEQIMFCTDDSHPDDLLKSGHIDKIVRRAIADGYDLFNVLKAASYNAVFHYRLPVGLLRINDPADFICVDNLKDFRILRNYINGECVYNAETHKADPYTDPVRTINNFHAKPITPEQLVLYTSGILTSIKVIDGQLWTEKLETKTPNETKVFEPDTMHDILKIVYYNRYQKAEPQVATISGFGLQRGAIASCVGHDSHNILAVGCTDKEIADAVNLIIQNKGGIAVVDKDNQYILSLPIGGIMSPKDCETLAGEWEKLHLKYNEMGGKLIAPFMTLAFMSLIVIPKLKIGERGLFDAEKFCFLSDNQQL